MIDRTQLAIVGAGPAGMAAAITAAEVGMDVTVIDSQQKHGGQYFKAPNIAAEENPKPIVRTFELTKITFLNSTTVWGIFKSEAGEGWLLGLKRNNKPVWLHAETLVLACGAYDLSIPFPGWTLPGVMTAGAAQILVKSQGIRPGRNVILAGSGALLFAAAANLINAGTNVVAVLQAPFSTRIAMKGISALWGQWARVLEGTHIGLTMAKARTPLRWGWAITHAHGEREVQAATIAQVDKAWQVVPETQATLAVDTIITGYGLLPNNHLGRMLNYAQEYRPTLGGWVPRRDLDLQTSLINVYVVGDMAGIRGAEAAQLEGHLAGTAVARKLGMISETKNHQRSTHLRLLLKKQEKFGVFLGEMFNPGDKFLSLAASDTHICRCEALTFGDIKQAIRQGVHSMREIKGVTRAGMGNCQGRMCEHLIQEVIRNQTGSQFASNHWSVRPPLHPLPLDFLKRYAGIDLRH